MEEPVNDVILRGKKKSCWLADICLSHFLSVDTLSSCSFESVFYLSVVLVQSLHSHYSISLKCACPFLGTESRSNLAPLSRQTFTTPELAGAMHHTLRVPSASIVPHISLYLVQVIALASPRFKGRKHVFAVIILVLCIYTQIYPHFTNNVGLAQPFTIAWSYYLATLAKLVFSGPSGPEGEYWHVDRQKQEALGYRAFGWHKIRWALALILNQRGIRWSHETKNVHPVEKTGKAEFLLLQAWNVLKYLLIADLLFNLSRRLFFTGFDGVVGTVSGRELTLRHPSWRWSLFKALVFGSTPYFMLSMQYSLLALTAVALGISHPKVWSCVHDVPYNWLLNRKGLATPLR